MSDAQIVYKSGVPHIAAWAEERLRGYMDDAGVTVLQINSTRREPEDQARAMLYNIQHYGKEAQLELYGATGDRIINVWDPNLSDAENKANMADMIRQIGPEKVSRHMANDAQVFDVAPSSVDPSVRDAFLARLKSVNKNPNWRASPDEVWEMGELFWPPKDPAYHVEFPNNSAGMFLPASSDDSSGGPGSGTDESSAVSAVALGVGGLTLYGGWRMWQATRKRRRR